jgi:glycosyltransferase involved in cell wall biosynthesis
VTQVSVVIPTRNRGCLLATTLGAALAQRDVDLEVIVVDDGSTDPLPDILDARVTVIRHEHREGVGAARNRGIASSNGDWVALLDDDDLWAPFKLALQLEAARAGACDWAYGGEVVVDPALRIRGGAPPPPPDQVVRDLANHNAVPAGSSNVVIRRTLLERVGGFDTELRTGEDWDMWLRLAAEGPPARVPRPVVAYRVHPGSASRDMRLAIAEAAIVAARHDLPFDRIRHYRWAAWTCLEDGDRGRALTYYGRAVLRGDVTSLGRGVAVLVGRRAVPDRHPPVREDPYLAEAEGWLAPWRKTGP